VGPREGLVVLEGEGSLAAVGTRPRDLPACNPISTPPTPQHVAHMDVVLCRLKCRLNLVFYGMGERSTCKLGVSSQSWHLAGSRVAALVS
jgi:hypothetical protein